MAGLFSSSTLEQIRAASDIVDVIGSYLPLKRAGANFVALCPFHKEKSPSFNVNPQRQIFHCFGCHKGGDVFTFVKEYETIDFVEAVKRLADRAKIPLEYEQGAAGQETKHLKDTLLQIHEQIAQRWQNCLLNEAAGQVARDYLAKRGVSAEAIKLFRLGAAPDAWDDTVNWAKSKGHDLATVERAGLIIHKAEDGGQRSEDGGQKPEARSQKSEGGGPTSDLRHPASDFRRYYDRFRGRLMFPICDEQGRVIGFSGRVLSGDEKTAKYVNSPETPIFTKSKVFFGLDKSKRAILDAGVAVICEGQLDLIACFMGGVQNIVAPQGTAFTDQHARILKRYADEAVLCFDSDEAGQKAAVRSLDHLLASGLAVRVAVVPAPHDPDSFIKANGGEAFRKLIENADGFFDYYLNRLCATNDAGTDKGRQAILQSMAEAVHKTGNNVLIDKFAQKTAGRLGVSVEAVRAEFKKWSHGKPEVFEAGEESSAVVSLLENQTESFKRELWLVKCVLTSDDVVGLVVKHLDLKWLVNDSIREVMTRCLKLHSESVWKDVPTFVSECPDPLKELITGAIADKRDTTNALDLIRGTPFIPGLLKTLRNQWVDQQLSTIQLRLNDPALSETEQYSLVQEKHALRQLKHQPLPPAP